MKRLNGGIILLFSIVVTFIALGILFMLNSTAVSGLKIASIDYTRSQLISNIQSGNHLRMSTELPAFSNDNTLEIETIESGTITIKRNEQSTSRFRGIHEIATLGSSNEHIKQIEDEFTISFWIRPINNVDNNGIQLPRDSEPILSFSQPNGEDPGAGFFFHYSRITDNTDNTVGRLNFIVTLVESGSQTVGFNDIVDNVWIFVTVVYNGDQLKIFRNGDNAGTTNNVNGNVDWNTIGNAKFYIGQYETGGIFDEYFSGMIRNLGLWSTAMTHASVHTMYLQGLNFNPLYNNGDYDNSDATLGFWKLNDGTGTRLIDFSVFGNDGSIINLNNSDNCWVTISDSFFFEISSTFNEFERSENLR